MSFYRDLILKKVQQSHECGGGHRVFLISKPVFDALEVRKDGGDKTSATFLSRLKDLIAQIKDPADHELWSGFFDTYEEACFYLVARERKVLLEGIATESTATPDFESLVPSKARFEIKTLNVRGGTPALDNMLYAGLTGTFEAEAQAKKRGIGFGEIVVEPHGEGASALDVARQLIDKLANNIKRGQFATNPTYLVASLDRLCVPWPEHFGAPQHAYDGYRLSSVLWHVVLGQRNDDFLHFPEEGQKPIAAPLDRAGILHTFPFIAGVIFKQTVWQELPEMDGAFRDQTYKLYGVRRNSADDHKTFDQLCDESLIALPPAFLVR